MRTMPQRAALWLSVLVLGVAACGQEGDTIIGEAAPPRQVEVTGVGRVTAVPDVAEARLGVQTYGPELAPALADNNQRMAAVLAVLATHGVAAADVQTANVSVYPQRDYGREDGTYEIVGFWVNNEVHATLRDLEAAGEILQACLEAGANSLNGLVFTLADFTPLRAQAREAAVADAAARAGTLAVAAGARLGRIVRLTELEVGGTSYYRAELDQAAGADAVPVAPGDLDVSVRVQAVYELE